MRRRRPPLMPLTSSEESAPQSGRQAMTADRRGTLVSSVRLLIAFGAMRGPERRASQLGLRLAPTGHSGLHLRRTGRAG